jgi:hypothetical protein
VKREDSLPSSNNPCQLKMSSADENGTASNLINTNPKTQEFNTITSSNVTSFQQLESSSPLNYTGSFPTSLPFFINPNTNDTQNNNFQIPLIYQPMIPFTATAEQVQQYIYMLQQRQVNSQTCSGNKRTKLATSTNDYNLKEQLNDFKDTLKSSFEKNLQKLEVLDRLVQNVTVKGNFRIENVKNAIEILATSKELLKQMISEQVHFTADLTSNLKQELINYFKANRILNCMDSSKSELVDKIRKEEDDHLTDLTILSSRNKELQKESKTFKEQLEKLQIEYSEALKTFAKSNEDYKNFRRALLEIVKIGDDIDNNSFTDQVLSSVELLLNENEGLKCTLTASKSDIETIIKSYQNIKEDLKDTVISNGLNNNSFDYSTYTMISCVLIDGLYKEFEEVLYFRERFYNGKIEELKLKIDNLIKQQANLTHQSLNMKIGLQSQLADFHENMKRLRKHCQDLTLDLNSTLAELDKKRLSLQTKESENLDLKRKTEILEEKLKIFEQEISFKNQENRTFSIEIRKLQNELEENSTKHRHDISALERKILILEAKATKKEAAVVDDLVDDPFSSLGGRESTVFNDHGHEEVSVVIPSTIAPKNHSHGHTRVVVTFTGIRDSKKQKEMTKWFDDLGATVHVGADFNDDITHVLAPRGYKSIRVLAASLTGKWIVPCEWVEACHRTNQFVSENLHGGYLNTTIRPFRFRTIWLSAAFAATHKSHPIYPVAALRVLLEKLGKARWCESAGQADFLLVTDEEKESKMIGSSRGVLLTLNNLINMIPIE